MKVAVGAVIAAGVVVVLSFFAWSESGKGDLSLPAVEPWPLPAHTSHAEPATGIVASSAVSESTSLSPELTVSERVQLRDILSGFHGTASERTEEFAAQAKLTSRNIRIEQAIASLSESVVEKVPQDNGIQGAMRTSSATFPETCFEEAEFRIRCAALAKSPTYDDFLGHLWWLYRAIAGESYLRDQGAKELRPRDLARVQMKLMEVFRAAYAASRVAIARQNIIFHSAIALPLEHVASWLYEITGSHDAGDAEDAWCALAFAGDKRGIAHFEEISRSPFVVRHGVNGPYTWPCTEEETPDTQEYFQWCGAHERSLSRGYRCIEVLDRGLYHWIFHLIFSRANALGLNLGVRGFPWTDPGAPVWKNTEIFDARVAPLQESLLPLWLTRYPEHPGSDDMAFRLAVLHERNEDFSSALRWASLASHTGDGDMCAFAVRHMTGIAEVLLDRHALATVIERRIDHDTNQDLLRYIFLRRTAAEAGFRQAMFEAESVALWMPQSQIGVAFNLRHAAPPPEGLFSSARPLDLHDPLVQVQGDFTEMLKSMLPQSPFEEEKGAPDAETVPHFPREYIQFELLDLARQFRAWESIANIEERLRGAMAEEQAEYLYMLAAIEYHERKVLLPLYIGRGANGTYYDREFPSAVFFDLAAHRDEKRHRELRDAWYKSALGWWRAIHRFETLMREFPYYPDMDKVLYSMGIAHVRLIDYRPESLRSGNAQAEHMIAAVALFERCGNKYPNTEFTPGALRAAAYWRRNFPQLAYENAWLRG